MGQVITFVSERQLQRGQYAAVDWIVIPHATHVTDDTVHALGDFVGKGGRVVMLGADGLTRDEYDRTRDLPDALRGAAQVDEIGDEQSLARSLREILARGGLKIVELKDLDADEPAWGVEYRIVPYQGRLLVPMINFLRAPKTVWLELTGQGADLLSGRPIDLGRITLAAMGPILIDVKPSASNAEQTR